MEKCRTKDLGDGWCDKRHNNLHCRWDGGDCCTSTSRDRVVRRVPQDCGVACDCKDPNARENLLKGVIGVGSGDSPSPDDEGGDDDSGGDGYGDAGLGHLDNSAQKILRLTTKQ